MNVHHLQDIVKGRYGRRVSFADEDTVTAENVVQLVADHVGEFNINRKVAKYLWDYKNGDQPILYRTKTVRDDIVNKVVENHAYEIVQFGVSQTYGEPIQYVSRSKEERVNKAVDEFNDYMHNAYKYQRNVAQGEWKSAVGTSFLAIQKTNDENIFRIVVPTPMNTFVIYSSYTGEPLLAVQELKDQERHNYYLCFSNNMEFKIQNGQLLYSKLQVFGGIPIVEIPNNQDRISDIEIVISMLDAINNMQSNRMDGIEQFVQSWIKFVNCEVDSEEFQKMKMMGALVVKSNNGENKADVEVMSQELNQSESQVAKDDLWENALSILAIPNKNNQNTGGDTSAAVALRNGWDHSRGRARLKDSYVKEAEMKFAKIALNVLRIAGCDLKITAKDFTVNIIHSPTDNLYTKAQALQTLLQSGVAPLEALTTCGLWGDSEKIYIQSKPYLDVLYKTVDMVQLEKNQETSDGEEKTNNTTDFKNTTGKSIEEL